MTRLTKQGSALLLAASLAAAFALASPAAASTTIGNATNGNCYPFSCGPTDGVTAYQQSYNAAAFSGPLNFNTISFDRYNSVANYDSGTYAVSFYLQSGAFGSLSSNLASNRGTLLGNFGTFTIGGASSPTLSLTGSAIHYDPTMGSLLMDVAVSNGVGQGDYFVFFNADDTTGSIARAFNSSYGNVGNTGGALVTTFSTVGGVPEPATWAMLILGFGVVGGAMRRRQRVSVRFA